MATSLLQGSLSIEEPLSSRPGFKGRSTIQEIDIPSNYEQEDITFDPIDTYLDEQAYDIYDYVNRKEISNISNKFKMISQQFLRRLLPLNCLDIYLSPYLPEDEYEVMRTYVDNYTVELEKSHLDALDTIRHCLTGKNLFLSLSLSSRFRLNHEDPRLDQRIKFLDVFIGTLDDYRQFLAGSFLLREGNFQEFLIEKIKRSLNSLWPNNAWHIQAKHILMILLTTDVQLEQESLTKIHSNLSSALIVPCLSNICSGMLSMIDSKFKLLKSFTKNLEIFLQKESLFYDLFCLDFAEFFSIEYRNYFKLVDFYGRNYWKIREHITMFCMKEEPIVKQITEVFTPQYLCSLFEAASVWQSLINVLLLIHNYWYFPHTEYSALIISLELENIVRHDCGILCDDLKQFRIDRLVLLSQFFNQQMPLVPATISNQVPFYNKMLQDFVPRGHEEPDNEDYLHNLTAIVYSTKEILYDYDYRIREHSHRFDHIPEHDIWPPFEEFGNFELDNCCELSIDSTDDSQLEIIHALHKKYQLNNQEFITESNSLVKPLNTVRKRHHSSNIF